MSSLFDLTDRVVILTGASAGVGRMLASGLTGEGAHVVLAARRAELLAELEADLPGSLAVPCDLTVEDDRARLVARTIERYGRIDGLVNNAGMAGSGLPATRQTTEEFVDVLQLDLVAPFDLAKRCLPAFREQGGGSVVNVTSTAAILSCAYVFPQAAYCAAKGGLAQLTKELAAQWARYGVRVNAFAPGVVDTPMHRDTPRDVMEGLSPMGRPSTVKDIADAVLYLTEAATVTGQILYVDGGAHFGRW